jgi:ubiquinone/menaquinone biosynthesis C-methylase UbiE
MLVTKMENSETERLVPDLAGYALWQEHINRYVFALNHTANKVVLDVACGSGYGTSLMAKKASLVVGVDVSHEALSYAKKHYGKHNVQFILSDASSLPFKDCVFDRAISFETIEHIAKYETFLHEIKRNLKKNGLLILSTPNKRASLMVRGIPANPFHVIEFSITEFSKLLQGSFTNIEFYGQCDYTILDCLFGFVLKHLPLKNALRNSLRPVSQTPSNVNVQSTVDWTYRVKKFKKNPNLVYDFRYFLAIANI